MDRRRCLQGIIICFLVVTSTSAASSSNRGLNNDELADLLLFALKNSSIINMIADANVPKLLKETSDDLKRTEILLGVPEEYDVNDPYIQDIADFAIEELGKSSNSLYTIRKIQILSASTQVVSGRLTHLKMEVGQTQCSKDNSNNEDCEISPNTESEICDISVWDQPWRNHREVTTSSCGPKSARAKRLIDNHLYNELFIAAGLFQNFMIRYNVDYPTFEECKYRFEVFMSNLVRINYYQETELATARFGITVHTDLTGNEFKRYFTGYVPEFLDEEILSTLGEPGIVDEADIALLPTEFDWRHFNAVTEVKNQGACASCWAFSTTGNVEGLWAIATKELRSLSEQELVDCDKINKGCSGGVMINTYKVIPELGGLVSEEDYIYEAVDNTCRLDRNEIRVQISGGTKLSNDETQMAYWLYKNAPISVAVNGDPLQFYTGGIMRQEDVNCEPGKVNHGVLITGFGVEVTPGRRNVIPYWIIKNSYGPEWGEAGYYRLVRGEGACGVNTMPTTAIL